MKLVSLIIPFAIALSTGCATKLDPCGDGMARADDGNCYPYEVGGDTGVTNQLPDADVDADAGADADNDEGPPPDDGETDADGGTDEDGGPPPDDGGTDEGTPDLEGPESCSSDEDCEGECFDEGTGCVCDEAISVCVPSCDSTDDCPGGMACEDGVCNPES